MTENQEANGKNRQWLNNYVGRRHLGKPVYEDHDELIPGTNRHIWTSTVQVGGIPYGQGETGTKGGAREQAAEKALAALKAQFGVTPDDEQDD